MSKTTTIEIFRAGRHTAMDGTEINFSDADIQAMAAGYDTALHEAPGVIGHPQHDAPAYAWAGKLIASGEKPAKLTAELTDVEPQFAEMWKAGRFKKVSPSFYTPTQKANPKPGVYYLQHIGFLGAMPPAVKGLKQAEFAEAGECLVFAGAADWSYPVQNIAGLLRGFREFIISKFSIEDADKVMPGWQIDSVEGAATRASMKDDANNLYAEQPRQESKLTKTPQEIEADLAARETALKARETAAAARDAQFAEAAVADRKKGDTALLDQLIKDGKWAPTMKAPTLAFMATLDAGEAVQFAETGDKQTAHAWFTQLLSKAGKIVNFGEASKPDGGAEDVPSDPLVYAEQMAEKATTYIAEQAKLGRTVDTATAIRQVSKESK